MDEHKSYLIPKQSMDIYIKYIKSQGAGPYTLVKPIQQFIEQRTEEDPELDFFGGGGYNRFILLSFHMRSFLTLLFAT